MKPLWPEDRPHLAISEVAEWFAAYVYLPKLSDRVVLEGAIRDALGKLDPAFGYADSFDESSGTYTGLAWAKQPPQIFLAAAVLVRSDVALEQFRLSKALSQSGTAGPGGGASSFSETGSNGVAAAGETGAANRRTSRAASTEPWSSTWCDRSRHSRPCSMQW